MYAVYKSDVFESRELTNCDMEGFTLTVTGAQCDIIILVTELHRSAMCSNNFICRKADEALFGVSKRLREALDCRPRGLQQSVCDAVRAAAKKT